MACSDVMLGLEWGDEVHDLVQDGAFSVQDLVELNFSLRESLVICNKLLVAGQVVPLGGGLYRCRQAISNP